MSPVQAVAARAGRAVAGRTAPVREARPLLRLVPQARASVSRASRTPFVVLLVGLLGAGLLGLLALNTVLAEGAFRLHSLEQQAAELATREQVLQRQVESLRAPGSLAQRARGLGMVDGGPPVHLRLSDGAVLGTPVAGVAPIVVAPVVPKTTTPGPAMAAPAAGASAAPAKGSTTWTAPRRATPAPRSSTAPRQSPAPRPTGAAR